MIFLKNKNSFSFFKIGLVISIIFLNFSCYAQGGREEGFVQALADPNLSTKERLSAYTRAIQSKNPYIAEKATYESLVLNPSGTILKSAKKSFTKFHESGLVLAKLVELDIEAGRLTDAQKLLEWSFQNTQNDAVLLSMQALQVRLLMAEKKDFQKELIVLFTEGDIGKEHAYFKSEVFLESLPRDLALLLRLRFAVYERNYGFAYRTAEAFIENIQQSERKDLLYKRSILSDIGKAFLYGSTDYETNASFFETLARTLPRSLDTPSHSEVAFISYFYAARILERSGSMYNEQVLSLYELSWREVIGADFDNALWYYLNLLEKISLPRLIQKIKETIFDWHDPSYFSDILERISYRLLSSGEWQLFYELYRIIENQADSESQARFAYLSARLIQIGLLSAEDVLAQSSFALEGEFKEGESERLEELVLSLFSKAFYENHSSLYYRILAAEKLDIPIEDTEGSFYSKKLTKKNTVNAALEEAILLYAKYGLYDLAYEIFLEHASEISFKTASAVAEYFAKAGDENGKLYPMSIRLAIRSVQSRDEALQKDILEKMYPRFFSEEVAEFAAAFSLEEYLIYALIRSESLFEKKVVSSAGAIGLAQLMKPTAGDIARKLGLSDYDLGDAATNIRFGTFYLRELLDRLDGSALLALSSYNAGITRVRNWARNNQLPADLFLETIPFAETREYSKKILSAAALYAYLYYDLSSHEIVAALLQ